MPLSCELVPYAKVRKDILTGDTVLFKGKGRISSLIRRFSGYFSHVGHLVRVDSVWADALGVKEWSDIDNVYLAHSTMFFGGTTGRAKRLFGSEGSQNGVQLTRFSSYLANYNGEVYIRFLLTTRGSKYVQKEAEHLSLRLGTPYERIGIKGFRQLLNSAYDGAFGGSSGDTSHMFCSEYRADNMIWHGFLPPVPYADERTPTDFAESFRLQGGAEWGKTVCVRYE